ncbi:cation:proton antiporter [Kitasatospora sp. NPDC087271]|uniref:cation:proton antiporter n=1 Tax=Kitasatospora sp. NPDC087271 TaxID=3364067 RepID=UPI00381C2E41
MDSLPYVPAAVTLALLVPVALLGRRLAKLLRQPEIVGEIMACLLLGALLASQWHWKPATMDGGAVLEKAGHLGLALFLVGAVHEIRAGGSRLGGRTIAMTATGSLLLPLGCGVAFAAWVLADGSPALRGGAPAGVLVLMLAIALAVTAVPVLAGILDDRGMLNTAIGRLCMAVAVSIDAVTWSLLAIAVGLAHGGGKITPYLVFVVGLLGAWLIRRAGALPGPRAWAERIPVAVPTGLTAAAAVAAALTTSRLGLTDVLGAVLVALALPGDDGAGPWTRAAHTVGGWGRIVLPLLFTVTGMGLASAPLSVFSWQAVVLSVVLAIFGKLVGSYYGARAAGRPAVESMRIAVFLNARGLTELAVLQTGYQAGILTPALFLALVVMALFTTVLSGPLLWVIDRRTASVDAPRTAEPVPYPVER